MTSNRYVLVGLFGEDIETFSDFDAARNAATQRNCAVREDIVEVIDSSIVFTPDGIDEWPRCEPTGWIVDISYGRYPLPSDKCTCVQSDDEHPEIFGDDISAACGYADWLEARTGVPHFVGWHCDEASSHFTEAGDVWVSPRKDDEGPREVSTGEVAA